MDVSLFGDGHVLDFSLFSSHFLEIELFIIFLVLDFLRGFEE